LRRIKDIPPVQSGHVESPGRTTRQAALRRLFAFQLANSFAEQFGWNFIFLYAFGQGFGLEGIAIYFLLEYGSCVVFIPLVRRLDIIGSMRAGLALRIAAFAILLHFFWWGQLYIASVLLGAFVTLFWIPYNTRYLQLTEDPNRAQSSAALFSMFAVLGATLPVVAGILIQLYDFQPVLVICIAVLAGAIAVSGKLAPAGHMDVEIMPMLERTRRLRPMLLAEGFWQGVFWLGVPLGLIMMVRGFGEYGAFYSLFGVLGAAASLIAGRWSDKKKARGLPIYVAAVAGGIFSMAAAAFIGSPQLWTLAMSLTYFSIYILWPFTFCVVTELSTSPAEAMTVREFLTNIGRVGGGLLVLGSLWATRAWSLGPSSALSISFAGGGIALLVLAVAYRSMER
jgi:hypothetical protein